MQTLMVSTSYPADRADWRGIFIRDMAAALARRSDMDLSLWAPPGALPDGVRSATTAQESHWLARLMARGGISHMMRQRHPSDWLSPLTLLRMVSRVYRRCSVDVYHINWLQCALPLPSNGIPALMTVLGNDLKLLGLPLMRTLLRRTMRSRKVAICPNADWMVPALTRAFGDCAHIVPVAFGIDERWFAVNRAPDFGKPMWLAVTRLTANKLGALFEWSEALFGQKGRELHLFGPMQESVRVPDWITYHGAATPEQLCVDWFPRAAGLITLSRHAEGRPQVMLEAMAAGLPIIASSIPAHADIVQNNGSGVLCSTRDEYASAVETLEVESTNVRMGTRARELCQQRFGTWDDCAQRYFDVYHELLRQ